jgi:hypothetical protein
MNRTTSKYRYKIFPDRIYFIMDESNNVIEITGQELVERIIDGQKSKEAERKTSELSETQS